MDQFLNGLTLRNFTLKLFGFGFVVGIESYLVEREYFTLWTVFMTMLILSAVGVVADNTIVPRFGNLRSLVLGFPAMTGIIWAIANLHPPTRITLFSAALMALSIGPMEYALHNMILKNLRKV